MSLTSRMEGKIVVLEWKGQLGVDNFSAFKDGVEALITQGGRQFIFDMSQVNFIDSRGLGVISGFLRKVKSLNGEFLLCALQEDVKPIFEITGLKKYCTITSTVSEGIQALHADHE